MSKVLFLSVPSHGHVNPTLGLVYELIQQGEEVIYFSSLSFKERIENTGAVYKSYIQDLNLFKIDGNKQGGSLMKTMPPILLNSELIIDDILKQTHDEHFDYMIYSAAFPFAKPMQQILMIPAVSSLAVFSGLKDFFNNERIKAFEAMPPVQKLMQQYKPVVAQINQKYNIQMPVNIFELLLNKGDINLVYTSKDFIAEEDEAFFDDTYKFVGAPIYERKETLDFPFEKLKNKTVIYISLGTVFGNYDTTLYDIFFDAFKDTDTVIVMAAYGVDLLTLNTPSNFIVRSYVPQNDVLKYAKAAITHAGMNSISDLIYNEVPFVSMPLGADQPALAKRAASLGATIVLDINNVTMEDIRTAVERVMTDVSYIQNIKKIAASFKAAGGYHKAVEEIFAMKKETGIIS